MDKSSFSSMTMHGKVKVFVSDYIAADNKRKTKHKSILHLLVELQVQQDKPGGWQ